MFFIIYNVVKDNVFNIRNELDKRFLYADDQGDWKITSTRELEGRAPPDYVAIEADNTAIRIASEKPFKLIYDSERPLPTEEENGENGI